MQEDHIFSYPKELLILSFFVAVLGGLVAIALEASTPQQALWIGASTPVIISKMATISPKM